MGSTACHLLLVLMVGAGIIGVSHERVTEACTNKDNGLHNITCPPGTYIEIQRLIVIARKVPCEDNTTCCSIKGPWDMNCSRDLTYLDLDTHKANCDNQEHCLTNMTTQTTCATSQQYTDFERLMY